MVTTIKIELAKDLLLVLLCMYALTASAGVSFSFGTYVDIWVGVFENGAGITSLLNSLNFGIFHILAPFANGFINAYGPVKAVLVGSLVTFIGLFLSAFATNVYVLLVTNGIISGIGMSLFYLSPLSLCANHFNRGRGMAMAIVGAGLSLGVFVLPFYIETSVQYYGWRGSLMLLSTIPLHGLIVASLLCLLYSNIKVNKESKTSPKEIFKYDLLRNIDLCMFLGHCLLFSCAISIIYVHLVSAAKSLLGLDDNLAYSLLSTMGIAGTVGRIMLGFLGYIHWFRMTFVYFVSTIAFGVFAALVPVCQTYIQLMIVVVFVALALAAFGCQMPTVAVEFLGVDNVGAAYGFMSCACGVGLLAGAPIAGLLFDLTDNYANTFYLGSGFTLVSSVLVIPVVVKVAKGSKSDHHIKQPESQAMNPATSPIRDSEIEYPPIFASVYSLTS